MRKRILVLSSSIGSGHTVAAEALCETARRSFDGQLELAHHDVMQLVGPSARFVYARAYMSLVNRNPHLWGYLYQKHNRRRSGLRNRRMAQFIAGSGRRRLKRLVRQYQPDRILATHFLAPDLLLTQPGKMPPVEVVVTDFDAHALWIHPQVSHYHVASAGVAAELRAAGVPLRKISVTGIPIRPAFAAPRHCRSVLRERYGLDPERPVLLVSCGGNGMSGTARIVKQLMSLDQPVQLLAVAGRNQQLYDQLCKLRTNGPVSLHPLGYVRAMHELMQASDLMVAKCGGLTASEALAIGLPLVVTQPIPGQETANSDHLLEAGAAVRADNPGLLLHKVRGLLRNPEQLQSMAAAARRAAQPGAAHAILSRHLRRKTARITRTARWQQRRPA